MPAPPPDVVRAFGASGRPVPLRGGRGTAWRTGKIVFKQSDAPADELRWQEHVLARLARGAFRIAVPIRSLRGELVVDGWSAWPWLAGRHAPRWDEILAVGELFHDATACVTRPSQWLDARADRWALADRIAWGEVDPVALPRVRDVGWLLDARAPIRTEAQLIHGDLSGNVLLAGRHPPAIIDFSPLWRPRAYASMIVAVDAIAWHGAGVELLEPGLLRDDGAQLLIRALLFRLLSDTHPQRGQYSAVTERLRRH